jgi:nanoRNase/pAp phosphatase (c-di-AMP/oligoRNAs hydrolase)
VLACGKSRGDVTPDGPEGRSDLLDDSMTSERVDTLLEATAGAERVLILTHNDPDPDAIGSAVALRHLLENTQDAPIKIAYRGIVGRAENVALVRYLQYPLQRLTRADLSPPVAIAVVDTQPNAGNSPLRRPADVAVVIDHHPRRQDNTSVRFAEVRPEVGATSTILTEYLRAAAIDLPVSIATALFYGIKSDTMGLGRSGAAADVEAYSFLVPLIDSRALFEIERAQVPAEYFRSLVDTLHQTRIYRDILLAYLGWMKYPDLAAEIADWLSRLKGIQWVVCLGAHKEHLNVAIRSRHQRGGAGRLAQEVIGPLGTAGGHGSMAGGQVPLDGRDPDALARQISQAVLAYFNISPEETSRSLV